MGKDNESGLSTGVKIAAGVVGAAAVGGLIYYLVNRGKGGDAASDKDAVSFGTSNSASGDKKKKDMAEANFLSGSKGKAAASGMGDGTGSNSQLLRGEDGSSFMQSRKKKDAAPEVGGLQMSESMVAMKEEEPESPFLVGVPDAQNRVHFPTLRCVVQLVDQWQVSDEVQSPAPNVALVQFVHGKFAGVDMSEMPPGEVPLCVLLVEDGLKEEGMKKADYAKKAKGMIEHQLRVMTQGQVPVTCEKDVPATVGPFTHHLEYSMSHQMFSVVAICYTAVVNGFGYQFQLFVKPSMLSQFRVQFFRMAEQFIMNAKEDTENFEMEGFLWLPLQNAKNDQVAGLQGGEGTHPGSFHVPTSWVLAKSDIKVPKAICPRDGILCALQTPSQTKPEIVLLCSKKPKLNIDGVEIDREATHESGVKITEIKVGVHTKHIKIFESTDGKYFVVTGPTSPHNFVVSDEVLCQIVNSVMDSACPTKTGIRYHSIKYGIAFDTVPGSKVLETRLEKSVIMYAPMGQHELDPNEMPTPEKIKQIREAPTVQVRVGNPGNDEDCQETLEAWEANVKKTSGVEGPKIKNLRRETYGERTFLAFESFEQVQVGMGQFDERAALMFVTMEGRQSALIRWEMPKSVIANHAGLMKQMLTSIEMFPIPEDDF